MTEKGGGRRRSICKKVGQRKKNNEGRPRKVGAKKSSSEGREKKKKDEVGKRRR